MGAQEFHLAMSFGWPVALSRWMSMSASRFDIARFGAEVFRGSPRQSDLMSSRAAFSNKMAPVIRHLYQQSRSRSGYLDGACATSTGVFNNYALVPVNPGHPVDVYVPAAPASRAAHPRSDAVAEKIQGQDRNYNAGLNLA